MKFKAEKTVADRFDEIVKQFNLGEPSTSSYSSQKARITPEPTWADNKATLGSFELNTRFFFCPALPATFLCNFFFFFFFF